MLSEHILSALMQLEMAGKCLKAVGMFERGLGILLGASKLRRIKCENLLEAKCGKVQVSRNVEKNVLSSREIGIEGGKI